MARSRPARGSAPSNISCRASSAASTAERQHKGGEAMERPKAWPHGARVAVLVSVLFESWSEGKSPSYFTRTTPLKPGAIDHAGVQWSRYAGSEGIGRILGVLQSCKVPATIFCNALAAQRHPSVTA